MSISQVSRREPNSLNELLAGKIQNLKAELRQMTPRIKQLLVEISSLKQQK
jgi:hypothetical protein